MEKIIRIGVDTSKTVFQVHSVDEAENPVLRKKLRRNQFLEVLAQLAPLSVGLEACGRKQSFSQTAISERSICGSTLQDAHPVVTQA
jgi:transposase